MSALIDLCLICKKWLWAPRAVCHRCFSDIMQSPLVYRGEQELDIFALFHFVGPVHDLVKVWKKRRNADLTQQFGLLLARKLCLEVHENFVAVVPIPPKIPGQRDHAHFVAESIAEFLKVPLVPGLLERKSSQEEQKLKTRGGRKETTLKLMANAPVEVMGSGHNTILIVDDVVTTGNTLQNAWRLLGRPRAVGLALASRPLLGGSIAAGADDVAI